MGFCRKKCPRISHKISDWLINQIKTGIPYIYIYIYIYRNTLYIYIFFFCSMILYVLYIYENIGASLTLLSISKCIIEKYQKKIYIYRVFLF